nr:reverse transcriptase domain-containing protein [Tanacetum cinerariifolium]
MNDVSLKAMQNQIDMGKNEMKTSIHISLSNQTNEIKNMMASLLQMNTASTSESRSLPGNTVSNPKGKLKAITTRCGLATDGPTVENSHFEENLTPVDTMTDNRTMAEMLRAPTEGCAEAIVVPPILAEQFELKHSLINMMTSEQFFGLEKDNPHDHVRCKPIASSVNACDKHSNSELAKLTHAVNQQTNAVTTAMTAILKQFQSNLPPAQVKVVEEICITCGGAHPYYQCLAAGGNTFPEYRDNIQ